ncbi:MAG: late competence development ComFB family protein [Pseudomonadota bacterium]
MDFSSVYNIHEKTIFEAVSAAAPRYPGIADDAGLLADVACVALNRMTPHYIRHSADLAFFTTEKERQTTRRNIEESVDFAFGYVQARHVMAARR